MEIKRAGSQPSAKGLRQEVKPYNIRTTVISAWRGRDGAAEQRYRARCCGGRPDLL
jgi:hypothetical protein